MNNLLSLSWPNFCSFRCCRCDWEQNNIISWFNYAANLIRFVMRHRRVLCDVTVLEEMNERFLNSLLKVLGTWASSLEGAKQEIRRGVDGSSQVWHLKAERPSLYRISKCNFLLRNEYWVEGWYHLSIDS